MLLVRAVGRVVEGRGTALGQGRTWVIAHRGASGYLPELSVPAFTLAYAMGADYLELDVVMSQDGVPVVFHDHTLDATTNVASVFPGRERRDGGWYVADFTLEEMKRLVRRERFVGRYAGEGSGFGIVSLGEALELVRELNRVSGGGVGVMVELKGLAFHEEQGLAVEEAVVGVLDHFGFRGDLGYVMSFDGGSLRQVRGLMGDGGRLVQLIGTGASSDPMLTEQGLDAVAEYAEAIGPSKRRIENESGAPVHDGRVVGWAQSRGLKVFPYTLRSDQVPRGHIGFESEVRAYTQRYGVDGIFTDHPDLALDVVGADPTGRARLAGRCARG